MSRSTAARWAIAAVVGLGLGVAAGALPGHHPEPPTYQESIQSDIALAAEVPPGDRIRQAAAEVRKDGFHVGPELQGEVTGAEARRIEEIIATAEVPLFVVWWDATTRGGYYLGSDALDQLRAAVGQDGFYAVIEKGGISQLGAVGFEQPFVSVRVEGRPGAALARYVQELAEVEPERPTPPGEDSDYWGGTWGGVAAGALFVALGFPVVLLVVWIAGRLVTRRRQEGTA